MKKVEDNLAQEDGRKKERMCPNVSARKYERERRGRGVGDGLRVILVSWARDGLIPSEFRE